MPVPVVTNIYPSSAHPSGLSMVRLLGANFSVQTNGTIPSLEVRFGNEPSTRVLVVNSALAYARVPAGPAPGPVELRVTNLNPTTGQPIDGESSTSMTLFRYRDVELTSESALIRVVTAFIQMLRTHVMRNVTMSHVHSDYDAATGDAYNLTDLQTLPSMVIIGPDVVPVAGPTMGEYVEEFGVQVFKRPPLLADLSFSLTVAADRFRQLINLQALLIAVFNRHPYLELDKDPDHPEQGKVRYEMAIDAGGAPSITGAGDENDVKTFGARVTIFQVALPGLAGFEEPGLDGTDVTVPVGDCGVELTVGKV